MNNAKSGLNQIDAFHLKNIEITEKIKLDDNTIFTHPILLGKVKYGTYKEENESSIIILDKKKTESNQSYLI